LFLTPGINRIVKLKRTGLEGHVAGKRTNGNTYSGLVIKSVGREPLGKP